ncbi:MAG: hypothetical protein ACK5UX_06905 [Burkholderiales bacterium]
MFAHMLPHYASSRIPYLRLPMVFASTMLILPLAWIADSLDNSASRGFIAILIAFFAALYVLSATNWFMRLARPANLQLVPHLRTYLLKRLISFWCSISTVLCLLFFSVVTGQIVGLSLVVVLIAASASVEDSRKRLIFYILGVAAAVVLTIVCLTTDTTFFRLGDTWSFKIETVFAAWCVAATFSAMIGLICVQPKIALPIAALWLLIMVKPTAIPSFDFNVTLNYLYARFTQAAVHALTAIGTISALGYLLFFQRGERLLKARGAASRVADLFRSGPAGPATSESLPVTKAYRALVARYIRDSRADRGGASFLHNGYALALGPSQSSAAIILYVGLGLSLLAAWMFYHDIHDRGWLRADLIWQVVIFGPLLLPQYSSSVRRRAPELGYLSLAPCWPTGRSLRQYVARDSIRLAGLCLACSAMAAMVLMLIPAEPHPLDPHSKPIGPLPLVATILALALASMAWRDFLRPTDTIFEIRARAMWPFMFLAYFPMLAVMLLRQYELYQWGLALTLLACWVYYAFRLYHRFVSDHTPLRIERPIDQ